MTDKDMQNGNAEEINTLSITDEPKDTSENTSAEVPEISEVPEEDKSPEEDKTATAVNTEAEANEEGQFSIFSVSTDDACENDLTESVEKTEPEERILPPDELFSVVDKTPIEKDAPETEEIYDYATENIDEDGQYRIATLPDEEETDEEPFLEEEIPEKKYDPEKPRKMDTRFDFVELFVFTLVAVMLITTFLFRHSIVEGESMEGTLTEGEHLIISDVFYEPKRGDIIVCADYTTAIKKPIVKRVIATEGETVLILWQNGENRVYVDGVLLDEEYVYIDDPTYKYYPLEITVPEGEVFVMGDHRNRSTDSRTLGTIDENSILGRVLVRFFPLDKFGKVE